MLEKNSERTLNDRAYVIKWHFCEGALKINLKTWPSKTEKVVFSRVSSFVEQDEA